MEPCVNTPVNMTERVPDACRNPVSVCNHELKPARKYTLRASVAIMLCHQISGFTCSARQPRQRCEAWGGNTGSPQRTQVSADTFWSRGWRMLFRCVSSGAVRPPSGQMVSHRPQPVQRHGISPRYQCSRLSSSCMRCRAWPGQSFVQRPQAEQLPVNAGSGMPKESCCASASCSAAVRCARIRSQKKPSGAMPDISGSRLAAALFDFTAKKENASRRFIFRAFAVLPDAPVIICLWNRSVPRNAFSCSISCCICFLHTDGSSV